MPTVTRVGFQGVLRSREQNANNAIFDTTPTTTSLLRALLLLTFTHINVCLDICTYALKLYTHTSINSFMHSTAAAEQADACCCHFAFLLRATHLGIIWRRHICIWILFPLCCTLIFVVYFIFWGIMSLRFSRFCSA